jgi:PAS domain S-box-containing protein
LRTLLDNVIDAIITIDEHGLIQSFNKAAERIFGYPQSAVLAHNVSMLMPEPDRSQHDQYMSRFNNSGEARVIGVAGRELFGLRQNGEQFPMELSVSEIQYQGERRFIGVIRDITERKRIDQMKNEFVSTVSHELRTPLTSITGALGLISGGALGEMPEAAMGMLQIAHKNSQRLGLLINDLLDMDKLVAGKMTFNFSQQPLLPLIEETLQSNQSYADEYGVSWNLQTADDDIRVRVDALRLQQVLANLLSNAAKFSPAGSQVQVRTELREGFVRISIEDQGSGIPAEFHNRIFGKFTQHDSSDTRQKGGTGLGLAISKQLIERMHGRIGFDSPPGRGACFWIELPAVEQP